MWRPAWHIRKMAFQFQAWVSIFETIETMEGPGYLLQRWVARLFPLYRNEGNDLFSMDTYPANIGFCDIQDERLGSWACGL